ncbi:hypothetical protein JCM3774_006431 [Rhodotorula dairenensis]
MLRATLSSARVPWRPAAARRHAHHHPLVETTPTPRTRPPPPKYLRFATVYPFILLSIITSLALNLSVQRTARETEGGRYRAQISVLEDLIARLRARGAATAERATRRPSLTPAEEDEIERELELVGLGRGRGKEAVSAEMSVKTDEATSWREVFLGKKGKDYEPEDDHTDWEAVFRQADEAERTRQNPSLAVQAPQPPPPSSPPAAPTAQPTSSGSPTASRPSPSKPLFL